MASQINTTNIDENFPVAGQDNDSQGFRDNFATIKNNFDFASSEISDLQDSTAKVDQNNNFNFNDIINANIDASVYTLKAETAITASQNINWDNGSYQIFRVEDPAPQTSITLTLAEWPATGTYAVTRVALESDGTSRDVYFNINNGSLKVDDAWRSAFTDAVTAIPTGDTPDSPLVFEFWTYNGGTTVFGRYLGQYSADPKMPKLALFTTSERNALVDVEIGSIIYNTDTNNVEVYKLSGWTVVG